MVVCTSLGLCVPLASGTRACSTPPSVQGGVLYEESGREPQVTPPPAGQDPDPSPCQCGNGPEPGGSFPSSHGEFAAAEIHIFQPPHHTLPFPETPRVTQKDDGAPESPRRVAFQPSAEVLSPRASQ